MYSSPARLRAEREATRRGNASTVVMSLLSLLVVVAAVAAVAYLVLRTPSSAVDSAERLEPAGTSIAAPSEVPALPTEIPTLPPAPAAPGFSGNQPNAIALPTVETPAAAPQEAVSGPTPTPRVIALPTQPPVTPPTQAAPAPTLPPAAPVNSVPVEALAPVQSAPPPTQAPAQSQNVSAPAAQPTEDDPFGILQEEAPRIAPAQSDAMATVRAMQDQNGPIRNNNRDDNGNRSSAAPTFPIGNSNASDPLTAPTPIVPVVVPSTNGAVEVQMPNVQATIDAITAQTLDPKRNPNVGDAGRVITGRDQTPTANSGKRKSPRGNRKTPTPTPISGRSTVPGTQRGNGGGNDDCPFNNLPAEQRPTNWPFDDCS